MKEFLQSVFAYIEQHPIELGVLTIGIVAIAVQLHGTGELKKAIQGRKW